VVRLLVVERKADIDLQIDRYNDGWTALHLMVDMVVWSGRRTSTILTGSVAKELLRTQHSQITIRRHVRSRKSAPTSVNILTSSGEPTRPKRVPDVLAELEVGTVQGRYGSHRSQRLARELPEYGMLGQGETAILRSPLSTASDTCKTSGQGPRSNRLSRNPTVVNGANPGGLMVMECRTGFTSRWHYAGQSGDASAFTHRGLGMSRWTWPSKPSTTGKQTHTLSYHRLGSRKGGVIRLLCIVSIHYIVQSKCCCSCKSSSSIRILWLHYRAFCCLTMRNQFSTLWRRWRK